MERNELAAWLRLTETPGIGNEGARRLLAAFGLPQAIFEAPASALREVVPEAQVQALSSEPEHVAALLEVTIKWLEKADGHHVISLGDDSYPSALYQTADPPLLLYAQGRIELLKAASIAIVGSRNPTPQGAANARAFAMHLSRAGLTVVSGMALGVDAAAHEGGLEGAAGTIAVVGTGLDRVYPRQNRSLAHRIAAGGLVISEYPLGTPPLPHNFPKRNRIISGLSRGTLVVEAALQSGSLITARLAGEQGREVFAIPGSIHSTLSKGCHALIKQGAKLVEDAQDIISELHWGEGRVQGAAADGPATDGPADPILDALGHDPMTIDLLADRTGWPVAELNARLLELELERKVARLPGALFQRVIDA